MKRFLLNNDGGYGNSKNTDGISYADIPALIIQADRVKPTDVPDTIENLIAEVESTDKTGTIRRSEIAVGLRAKAGRAKYDFNADKAESDTTLYTAILGFAYLLLNNRVESADMDITTTLAIDDFKDDENVKKMSEMFCKEWKVKFKHGHLSGKEIKLVINENRTTSQGGAGIWNFLLDPNGKQIRPVKGKRYLGVDIGFETTCIYIMDDGQDDGRSKAEYIGVSDYNTRIVQQLNKDFKTRLSIEQADKAIITGYLGNIDIKKLVLQHYSDMVDEIIKAITMLAPSTKEFNEIFLMGGGAYKAAEIFKSRKGFENVITSSTPHRDNLNGSRKLAKIIWKGREYHGS